MPNPIVRVIARFDPGLRSVAGELGHKVTYSSQKAGTRLGWSPRPLEETIVDCAQSLARSEAADEPAA